MESNNDDGDYDPYYDEVYDQVQDGYNGDNDNGEDYSEDIYNGEDYSEENYYGEAYNEYNYNAEEPDDLHPSGFDNVAFRKHHCEYRYPEEWISDVTAWCCEDSAIKACNEYQRRQHCALAHIRGGGRPDLANGKKGKINLVCVQGIDHTRSRNKKPLIRKKQHGNFRGCRMRIFIRQQIDGVWLLRSFIPEHIRLNGELAHLSGSDVYKLSRQAKEDVEKQALECIQEYKKVNAPTRAIANRLGEVLDVHYTSKDIINRANKIQMFDSDKVNVEVFLEEIKKGGGKVLAKFHEGIVKRLKINKNVN